MAIKYLVINHPYDADIKTVMAYDTPPVPVGAGFLNFDDSDGNTTGANTADINITVQAQTVSVPFTYGGAANFNPPVIGQFAVGSNNPGYVTNEAISLNSSAGTGTLTFDVTNNQSGTSTGRSIHITYTGDTTGVGQIPGHYRVTVLQAGGTYVQK